MSSEYSNTEFDLHKYFQTPTDQHLVESCRLTTNRIAVIRWQRGPNEEPKKNPKEYHPVIEIRRADPRRNPRWLDEGFSTEDTQLTFRMFVFQFMQLVAVGAFRILQASCQKLKSAEEQAGMDSNTNAPLPEAVKRHAIPITRIADTQFGFDITHTKSQTTNGGGTIPAGFFPQIRRLKNRSGPPVYEPPSALAAGLRVGRENFSKLYRALFTLPKMDRETFTDHNNFIADTQPAQKMVPEEKPLADDNGYGWTVTDDETTTTKKNENKDYTENTFQQLLEDCILEHREVCSLDNGCHTCAIDINSIENWDETHRGGALFDEFGAPHTTMKDHLEIIQWRKASHKIDDGRVGSASPASKSSPTLSPLAIRLQQNKLKRQQAAALKMNLDESREEESPPKKKKNKKPAVCIPIDDDDDDETWALT